MFTNTRQLRILAIFCFSLILSGFFIPTQGFADAGDSIRVAIVYNDSKTGTRYQEGITDAISLQDIKKWKLKIINVPYDKSEHGEDTIKKLIRNDSVDIVLGPTESQVFTQIYNSDGIEDKKVSVISGLATTSVGNDPQGYFFRLNLEATERVSEVWNYMDMYHIKNVAVIYEKSEFGKNAESKFRKLLGYSSVNQEYTSLSFESPFEESDELFKLVEKRPEVIGLFCERDEIQNIYRRVLRANKSRVPYHPYFFTLIDITMVSEGLQNFYFPSLMKYNDTAVSVITHDEVYRLGQVTGRLLIEALNESGPGNNIQSINGRAHFRNQVVGILRGLSGANLGMNFLQMKNLGPAYLYKVKNDQVKKVETDVDIHWFTLAVNKAKLLYSVHDYKLIVNILLIILLTISVSSIEIRRSFPQKHVKIQKTKVFYYFLFAHLLLVIFLYIYLSERGSISYFDTLMVIIIAVTPSAFFKTTFFESRSGRSFGLEGIYKRIMANIDAQIMTSRYEKLVGLENVIAYSNSEDSMKRALLRMYKNNPSKIHSAKLIQKMEEDLSQELDYMNRKRAAARLIMRQFDKDQLMAEGFVPPKWNYDEGIDPVILLRYVAKSCAADPQLRKKLTTFLNREKKNLENRNPSRYKELMEVHNKELSITMSNEGELLVELRLLMVLKGFNLEWLKEKGFVTDDLLKTIKEASKKAKSKKKGWLKNLFTTKEDNSKKN